jgi:hypothetical protein
MTVVVNEAQLCKSNQLRAWHKAGLKERCARESRHAQHWPACIELLRSLGICVRWEAEL